MTAVADAFPVGTLAQVAGYTVPEGWRIREDMPIVDDFPGELPPIRWLEKVTE